MRPTSARGRVRSLGQCERDISSADGNLSSRGEADLGRGTEHNVLAAGKLVHRRHAFQRRIDPFCDIAGARFGVAGLKAAAEIAGYAAGPPRAPLQPASPQTVALIREQYEALLTSA